MGILTRIFGGRAETRAAPTSWDLLASMGMPTLSGGFISTGVIEGNAAAFNAVQIIAEAVGSLPLGVYNLAADDAREENASHPVARLFTDAPNDMQTPAEFITMMQANVLLHGAA